MLARPLLEKFTTQRFSIQIHTTETKPNPNPNTNPNPNPNPTDPTKPYHLTVYGVGWWTFPEAPLASTCCPVNADEVQICLVA